MDEEHDELRVLRDQPWKMCSKVNFNKEKPPMDPIIQQQLKMCKRICVISLLHHNLPPKTAYEIIKIASGNGEKDGYLNHKEYEHVLKLAIVALRRQKRKERRHHVAFEGEGEGEGEEEEEEDNLTTTRIGVEGKQEETLEISEEDKERILATRIGLQKLLESLAGPPPLPGKVGVPPPTPPGRRWFDLLP